jgi:hypothetical protein
MNTSYTPTTQTLIHTNNTQAHTAAHVPKPPAARFIPSKSRAVTSHCEGNRDGEGEEERRRDGGEIETKREEEGQGEGGEEEGRRNRDRRRGGEDRRHRRRKRRERKGRIIQLLIVTTAIKGLVSSRTEICRYS